MIVKYLLNSLEVIYYVVNIDGIDGCEIDCQLLVDGMIWLCYDVDLGELISGSGCINEKLDVYFEGICFKLFGKEKLVRLKDFDFFYG